MSDRLPLSIVLATTEPWPDLANCLEALVPQVAALGGEIIVGDGHGAAMDAARAATFERLSWIRAPGASVFELRARGVERARGDVVALTEDHCIVGKDWCAQILEALESNPEAAAVTGPVLNGSTELMIDWANFFHTFGSCCPPVDPTQRLRCPPPANVAFRRSVFGDGPIPTGEMEFEISPRLFRQGLFHVHDGMTVTHVQSHGFWGTLRAHFDNGRSTTGLHRVPLSRRQLPWNLVRATLRAMSPAVRSSARVRAALPLILLLSCSHAAGEVTGILAGPGRSPGRLR